MMRTAHPVSLDDTAYAFAHKTDKELKLSHFLFSIMHYSWFINLSTRLIPFLVRLKLPINGLIRKTIFKQFVGGEDLAEAGDIAGRLRDCGVGVIIDYGLEGITTEKDFEASREEYIRLIRYASSQSHIPFISLKVTALARPLLLEQLNTKIDTETGCIDVDRLQEAEKQEWLRVVSRMYIICKTAAEKNIGVLVDAEESWIQNSIDATAIQMMLLFNISRPVVYNTCQLYRHDGLASLARQNGLGAKMGFVLGAKLVRGAYMEKERKRAAALNYPSPIHTDKRSTDADYEKAIRYCLAHISNISFIVASHNEQNHLDALRWLMEKGLPANHPHIHFSQLYGMSDNISFNMAKAGCTVSKYLPYGPVTRVIPYLMRRVRENSSVAGQTGRELDLIRKERERRKHEITLITCAK